MRAVSNEDRDLEAMIVATKASEDEEQVSDFDSDDDSINTTEELEGDIGREVDEYLFNRASCNDSVSTLDTRMGKTGVDNIQEVHEIVPSPTKKQKASHDRDTEAEYIHSDTNTDSIMESDNESNNTLSAMDTTGAEGDSVPLQLMPRPPELPESSGEGL